MGGGVDSLVLSRVLKELKSNKAIASMHKCLYYGHKLHGVLHFTDTSTSSLWLHEEVILRLFFASVFEI